MGAVEFDPVYLALIAAASHQVGEVARPSFPYLVFGRDRDIRHSSDMSAKVPAFAAQICRHVRITVTEHLRASAVTVYHMRSVTVGRKLSDDSNQCRSGTQVGPVVR